MNFQRTGNGWMVSSFYRFWASEQVFYLHLHSFTKKSKVLKSHIPILHQVHCDTNRHRSKLVNGYIIHGLLREMWLKVFTEVVFKELHLLWKLVFLALSNFFENEVLRKRQIWTIYRHILPGKLWKAPQKKKKKPDARAHNDRSYGREKCGKKSLPYFFFHFDACWNGCRSFGKKKDKKYGRHHKPWISTMISSHSFLIVMSSLVDYCWTIMIAVARLLIVCPWIKKNRRVC